MRRKLVLGASLAALAMLLAAPTTRAYGNVEQWQIGFSGTCSNTSLCGSVMGAPGVPAAFGFWGWCAFGGSNGSDAIGTTGTTADCQLTFYFRGATGPNNPVHIARDGTGWIILGSSPLSGGLPDFQFLSGTYEVTGPGANAMGFVTGVVLPLPTSPGKADCNVVSPFLCDTGLPAIPGHLGLHPFPGYEINIQVNKLP